MTCTDTLAADHRLIERALVLLEFAAEVVARGGSVRLSGVRELVDFARTYAGGIHQEHEEQIFFPALEEAGAVDAVAAMFAEHEEGRALAHEIGASLGSGLTRTDDRTRFVRAARGFVDLMREHVEKEDTVLFGLARTILPPERQAALAAALGAAHGAARTARAKYEAILDDLQSDMRR